MTGMEFGMQIDRLKLIYGDKGFPEVRVKAMYQRYQNVPSRAFALACDWVVLSMPNASAVVAVLDEKLKYAMPQEAGAQERREPTYKCNPCRDFGYLWDGDLIIHCKCETSKSVSWDDLKRHQENYNKGKAMMPTIRKYIRETGESA